MNLRDFKYVLALAEHRHFGQAAEACHVSQPTLSGQIKKLEDYLGVSLFERTNKWVELTDAGHQILPHAARAVEAAEAVSRTARACLDPLAGRVRIGILPTISPYLLPLILKPLTLACPKLELAIVESVTGQILHDLNHRTLDFGIIATPPPEDGFNDHILFTDPFIAVLPADHALCASKTIDASALEPDLLVLQDGHCLGDQVMAACGSRIRHGRDLRAVSLETLVQLVAGGLGTTMIPSLAAASFQGRGIALRPIDQAPKRTIRLISRPTFGRPALVKALSDVIQTASALIAAI
jgi:LysR family hydrogen peroxide-inducible transcriptional activator